MWKRFLIKKILIKFIIILYLVIYNYIQAFELEGNFIQGGLVIGKTQQNTKVFIDSVEVPVDSQGNFLIGFSRKNKKNSELELLLKSGKRIYKILNIESRDYVLQKINNLEKKKVVPPEEFYERIKNEQKLVQTAKKIEVDLPLYKSGFMWPTSGIITGVYGSQRVLNNIPRRPHYGIDIANKLGTPVLAPADGNIVLINKDLYFAGGTIIISHGQGLSSSLLHLSDIYVKEGQSVKKGEKIATMGSTGRATGPHLDWRMELRGTRIDPQLLVDIKKLKKKF